MEAINPLEMYNRPLPNPLAPVQNWQNTQKSQQEIQSNAIAIADARAELLAKNAVGKAAQDSIDKKTGKFDSAQFLLRIAGDPNAQRMAPEVARKVLDYNKADADRITTVLANGKSTQDRISEALTSLLKPEVDANGNAKLNPDGSPAFKNIEDADLVNGMANFRATNPEIAKGDNLISFGKQLMGLPPDQRTTFVSRLANQTDASRATLANMIGPATQVNQGGRTAIVRTPPTGPTSVAATLASGLTPGEASERVPQVSESGQPQTISKGAITPGLQSGLETPGRQNPFTATTAMPEVNPMVSQAQTPVAPVAPAPPAQGGATINTGLPPTTKDALERMSAEQKALADDIHSAQQVKIQVSAMRQAVAQMHTGGLASTRAKLGQLAQGFGLPDDFVKRVANGSLPASQVFDKLANQSAMMVLRQAIGGQGRLTNLEFATFKDSNPNLDTDPRAVEKMLTFFDRVADLPILENKYLAAYQLGFNKSPKDFKPEEFESRWNAIALKKIPELTGEKK